MHTEAIFENIALRIEKEINQAEKSIIIAVAWFTNQNLFETILRKAKKGCQVSLIITNDDINNNSSIDFERLNIQNSTVYKIESSDRNLMHNKFCVIDFSTVITGSYNWSYKAESNHENIVVNYGDLTLAKQFINEFNYIKSLYCSDEPRKKIKDFLKSYKFFFIKYISGHYPLSERLLEKYSDEWDWKNLSFNENLPWSENLLDRYIDRWDWWWISRKTLPWSEELIEKYIDKWRSSSLSSNKSIPWSEELIEKYSDIWDWSGSGLSFNYNLPWSEEFLDRYFDKWDWQYNYGLSQNASLPWTEGLIDKYIDKWNWKILSGNKGLPWSEKFLEKYFDKWDWDYLSSNEALPWSEEFLENYFGKWNWKRLSGNRGLPWSTDFFKKYIKKWNSQGLSRIESLSWSEELIEMNFDKWYWIDLSKNRGLPWSEEFLEKYFDKWDWDALFWNEAINWDLNLLHKYVEDRMPWIDCNYYEYGSELTYLSNNIKNIFKPFVDDNLIEEVFEEFKNTK